MKMKFRGRIDDLISVVEAAEIPGEWQSEGSRHTFRSYAGGILNWWPTGTVQFQGKEPAKSQLARSVKLCENSNAPAHIPDQSDYLGPPDENSAACKDSRDVANSLITLHSLHEKYLASEQSHSPAGFVGYRLDWPMFTRLTGKPKPSTDFVLEIDLHLTRNYKEGTGENLRLISSTDFLYFIKQDMIFSAPPSLLYEVFPEDYDPWNDDDE